MATRTEPRRSARKEIVRRLSTVYGRPSSRPHGDPMAELVLTVLSQNTSDANSGRAFARLMASFPDWQSVLAADTKQVEAAIQVGGLARTKAPRLHSILEEVWRRWWRDTYLPSRSPASPSREPSSRASDPGAGRGGAELARTSGPGGHGR